MKGKFICKKCNQSISSKCAARTYYVDAEKGVCKDCYKKELEQKLATQQPAQ